MTTKLYLDDAYLTEFTARVLRIEPSERGFEVLLDRTCFYPESGGQPCDLGRIGEASVLGVSATGDEIIHTVAPRPEQAEVRGVVDWARRFDHMQQHTGQHLLTQCFIKAAGSSTVGFALGPEHSSIELDRDALSREELFQAEEMANRIVSEARRVDVEWIRREELASHGVRARGLPADLATVRVVEIERFDRSACGGTHVKNTAEIGPIRIIGVEGIRGRQRVFFVCGQRAHADHRRKGEILDNVCRELTTGANELLEIVKRKASEVRRLSKELESTRMELARHLAATLLRDAEKRGDLRVVARVFEGWGMPEMTALADAIAGAGRSVALIGSRGEKTAMTFAASPDSGIDAGRLMKIAAEAVGGKGGGSPTLSRGGLKDPRRLEEALETARMLVSDKGS